jgi:sec-independent protein translocase protein TatB
MFGIGPMELFVIFLVGVVVLGPEQLPKIVRSLTKVMSDVRRVSTDFQRTINLEANKEEWEQKQAETTAKKKKKKKAVPRPESETAAAPETAETPDAAETAAAAEERVEQGAATEPVEMPEAPAAMEGPVDAALAQTAEKRDPAAHPEGPPADAHGGRT